MRPRTLVPVLLVLAVTAGPPGALAQIPERPGTGSPGLEPTGADMPTVGGNLGNQHYSGLTQIAARNLDRLGPAWRTHVSAVAPATDDVGQQTTPIVADGVIYTDTPGGEVIAVDGATGAPRWKWAPEGFATADTRRGVSIGDGKVYTLADGDRVVALDKDTGRQVWAVQPSVQAGVDLGSIDRVATVHHDGVVYAHAANGDRAAVVAVRAADGGYLWHFFGGPGRGMIFTDVNGRSVDAGATWGPVLPDGTECNLEGGATPWMHGAADPALGLYYMTFGNPRSCRTSQDGSLRPGDNLFSDTVVAVDLKTGAYRWHYQSIRHDIWDMDNVHPPTLADITVDGRHRKALFYGSKSGHQLVLDRTDGRPVLPVTERPMIQDSRQKNAATQPFPVKRLLPECLVWQKLDPRTVPGDPWRAVPNYNGYQADANGNLVFNPDSYVAADEPFLTYPQGRTDHRRGCLYDPQWDLPILSTTSPNGGGDWSNNSYSHRTNLVYFPYGTNPAAHWNGAASNGQRAIGQYQTGGILAYDASTGEVRWRNHLGTDMAHGQGPLTTASDLLFVGQADGRLLAMDARKGTILWQFQTGSAISGAPITYTAGGEQYVAVLAAGATNPYGASVTQGDSLWAFKLGGTHTTESGSQEGPDTAPLTIRRPVQGGPVEGATVNNTVYLGRQDRTTDTAPAADSTSQRGMAPTHLRVPVGTTVTFRNPGAETFPNFPNRLPHCATQYFEGLFNPRLDPGETFEFTFGRAGEYYFNDCTDPRPAGKIEVYPTPRDLPGALRFLPSTIDLGSPTGIFTGVRGTVAATLRVPAGYRLDGDVVLSTPLSRAPVTAVRATVIGGTLTAIFDKADLDNNVPEGDAVALTLSADLLNRGEQQRFTSTTPVRVVK
ncbi:glucose dehydrogenase/plastocyanin [Catenuloplanes nepalensis]|uniref:Glucose dehydrogenase/plastocyanin n=1 Tax=Catenuloplanes nepalensis TaxID=587533 RepID=A0ABT9MNV3_9ACTN|nr:PQQ-binding-like beta-propeller repeat protein [Catenuloplanes nepalensis]MDP9793104.1 glucose dehydrogenase/plastocyanin [Catenuloplanes nepalensis]